MSKQTTNLTADGTTLVGTLDQSGVMTADNKVGIHAAGTFGSGTLTFQYSLDGGTTKATIRDGAGSAATTVSYTDNGGFTWDSPLATSGQAITLYAVLSGSSGADIDISIILQKA